ncbi:MerR family transcriptional regulator [Staphylospora marina]|uniref:MerR family transcriptional regulator n=1 Tax=Staphylospora marina TaxID=2490858 RepID=UPI0013DDB2F0|nr:MerR family transcriptional regulator [Staphylospora marina]
MRIREAAERLKTTPRTLRFYEEKGLLTPEKCPENGYRIYSMRDLYRLQTILTLRETGMPLERIREVLHELDRGNREEPLWFLQLQRAVLYGEWLRLKRVIQTLDDMIERMETEQDPWNDLWRLAEQSRRAERERESWRDVWNFDRLAEHFDTWTAEWSVPYDDALDRVVETVMPLPGETGLEIGTGTGNLAGRFLDRGIRMCAIDQSREMLRVCRRKFPDLTALPGNFLAIPWPDGVFDFAVSSFTLHWLTDDQKELGLDEIRRVLKPGGRICLLDVMETEETPFPALSGAVRFPARISRLTAALKRRGFEVTAFRLVNDLHVVFARDASVRRP